ncbi:glycerophosphoryl diester phosphodiesterase membrane domain-containing protein [Ammonicoccus fulvus]|uniref:Glycerophosphoryl diester phosphodiesterase membrane domain-containing protein n=1 Tax=Ammonicoccus fulvus TaxID=3138240 RepID=A0ABZ3FR77_9ACTN
MTTQPTQPLRPSPLDLGGVISGAFRIFRQRVGAFAFLAFIPSILISLLVMAAMVPLIWGISVTILRGSFSGLIVLGIVLMFAAVVVGSLAQIKVQAMMVLGAHDVIHGRPSDNRDLYARTKGVVGRVLLLWIAVVVAIFLVMGLLMGGMFAAIMGAIATSSDRDPTGAIVTAVVSYVVFLLLIWVLSLVIFYFQVRFLYVMPALAVEQLPVIDSLKRSWALTKGNVLRTLGYYLVGSMLAGLASFVVQMFSQVLTLPINGRDSSSSSPFDLVPMLAVMAIVLALQIAVQVLAVPFLASYQTVMYVDQLRRNSLPPGYARGSAYPAQQAPQPGPYASGPQAPYAPPTAPPLQWQPQSGQNYPGQNYPGQVHPGQVQPGQPGDAWGPNAQQHPDWR